MIVYIVVPAYNEEKTVVDVIRSLNSAGYSNVLVVDDGSDDRTAEEARNAGAQVVRHAVNRGVGAATITGMEAAFIAGADVVVTFDADGQHDASDIANVISPIESGDAHIVLGVRRKPNPAPLLRKIANSVANFVTWILCGIWVKDSQSGFRAYTKQAVEQMDLHANGYEFCTEVIREMHYRKIPFAQVPVSVRYNLYTLSKGQSFDTGIGTLMKLIIRTLMR